MLSVSEGLISLAQAAKKIPSTRGGRTVHPATVWRWAKQGYKTPEGVLVRLEVVRVGFGFATTEAAIDRFIAAITGNGPDDAEGSPAKGRKKSTPAGRRKLSEEAEKRLERMGY